MANIKSEDPIVAYSYALEFGGKIAGVFTNVSGIGSETEVITEKLTSENGRPIIKQIPGRLTWTPITLKRGVTTAMDIWEWRQLVVDGKIDEARINASIIALDQKGNPTAQWDLENCWPSKVDGPEMDSGSTNYMVETLTVVHEGMVRVK